MDEIVHESTKEITCPHCGVEQPYSYEYCNDGEESGQCWDCAGWYIAKLDQPITYSTRKD